MIEVRVAEHREHPGTHVAVSRWQGRRIERHDQQPERRVTRLWILADLHLEAVPHPELFRPEQPNFDVLVVAGDLWEGDSKRSSRFVAELAGGKPSVAVLDNHKLRNGQPGRPRQRGPCGRALRRRVAGQRCGRDRGSAVCGWARERRTARGPGMRHRTRPPESGSPSGRVGERTPSPARIGRSIAPPGRRSRPRSPWAVALPRWW